MHHWKSARACRALVISVVTICATFSQATAVHAQAALVLGAGGSRGLAHAGAIVGLERRGFQPDLVVGASMGAIIGGLYASGMEPAAIWELTQTQDWQELFSPPVLWPGPSGAPRRPMTRMSPFADHTRFPDGLIPDWRVNRLLVHLFLDAAFRARSDFDALPRRFRSVAADIRTGEPVVIGGGDLARAIRASMSVPGAFAPVRLGGMSLVDGGLADYLPVAAARDAGADRVIAVDVIRPPLDEVGLNPFQVTLRAFRMTLYNARINGDSADLTLTPEIDPNLFAAVFLRDPTPLLDAGLAAALAVPDTLTGGGPARLPGPLPTAFSAIRVEANDPAFVGLVRETFARATRAGYDRKRLLDALDGLYSTGLFSGIWPRVESGNGEDTLVVFAEAVAPTTVAGAAGYDTDRGFRGWLALTHRSGSRIESTVALNGSVLTSWASGAVRLRPVNRLPAVGIDFGGSIRSNAIRAFEETEPVAEFRVTRAGGWVGLGWRGLSPDVEAAARFDVEKIDDRLSDGVVSGPTVRVSKALSNGSPVGQPLRLEAEWRYGDFDYRRFRAGGSLSLERGGFAAALVGNVATVRGSAPPDAFPALGDDHAMPGLRWGRLRGRTTAIGGIDVALASPFESHTRLRLRSGTVTTDLSDLGDARWRAGAEVGLLWLTPLGRIEASAGVMEGGNWLVGLNVGPTF